MKPLGNPEFLRYYQAIGKYGLLLSVFLISTSCSSLPEIQPFRPPLPKGSETRCEQPFVKNKWQFVHSIRAVLPNGQRQSMIGTIIVTPERNMVHCILMSIEGLVLLDIVYDQKVIVNRAVPPFDEPEMNQGLIWDVRLMFLKPEGVRTASGVVGEWSTICRYTNEDGSTVDVIVQPNGNWQIDQYSSFDFLQRSVQGFFVEDHHTGVLGEVIPERLELIAPGFMGYKLSMNLIEAIPLFSQGLSE
ncbi:MAG: hypothetical protein C0403_14245 [Desulfobacterium sp.]|nr:hypothetical protein [Desulfobacterium sp.]